MKKQSFVKDVFKGMTPNTQQKRPGSPMATKPVKKLPPSGKKGK